MLKHICAAALLAACALLPGAAAGQTAVAPQYVCGTNAAGTGNIWCNPGNANGTSGFPVAVSGGVSETASTYVSCATLCASKVIDAAAGKLTNFTVQADSTLSGAAWWVMIFDATALPSNGTVTPAKCYAQPSGATGISGAFSSGGVAFLTGITIGVSTTGCFSLTTSTHAFISGDFHS